MSNLAAAFIYLCPFGTLPADCGPATAVEFHIISVPIGSCGLAAQAMAAGQAWDSDGESLVMKIVCQRELGDQ